jgi:hypothetical protein
MGIWAPRCMRAARVRGDLAYQEERTPARGGLNSPIYLRDWLLHLRIEWGGGGNRIGSNWDRINHIATGANPV